MISFGGGGESPFPDCADGVPCDSGSLCSYDIPGDCCEHVCTCGADATLHCDDVCADQCPDAMPLVGDFCQGVLTR